MFYIMDLANTLCLLGGGLYLNSSYILQQVNRVDA
nr:MAG TPA: hypothetical protein [Caudoviricetes sp.]